MSSRTIEMHVTARTSDLEGLRALLDGKIAESGGIALQHVDTPPVGEMGIREAVLIYTLTVAANVTANEIERLRTEMAAPEPVVAVEVEEPHVPTGEDDRS